MAQRTSTEPTSAPQQPRSRHALKAALLVISTSGCSTIETLGRHIPQDDLVGDYLRALVWAFALTFVFVLVPVPKQDKPRLVKFWGAKIAVTLGAMLFYEYRYFLDAHLYFLAAQGPFKWTGFEFGAGTKNIHHLAWLHEHIVPDSYHAMKVSSAMLGLWAIYLFYRAAVRFLGRDEPRLFWTLALYPSILFWSSILGKDPIVLLGIATYVYGVVLWAKEGRTLGLSIALLGLTLAVLIRTWLGPILLAPLIVFLLIRAESTATKAFLASAAGGAFLIALSALLERFGVESSDDLFSTATSISRGWAHGGAGQQIDVEFSSISTMLSFAPLGIVTALFRPLPFEILNPFGLMAGLENVVLLGLLIVAISRSRWRDLRDPIIAWAVVTIFTWALVYGFVSYQNLGGAVRFRLQVLPLMICVLLYLARPRQRKRSLKQAPDTRATYPTRSRPSRLSSSKKTA